MRPSRGMGAIMPDKMPKGKKIAHKDSTDFTQFKEGGAVEDKKVPESVLAVRGKKGGPVGLYANINARKKQGISRSKSKSTISPKAYANMKKGFPK